MCALNIAEVFPSRSEALVVLLLLFPTNNVSVHYTVTLQAGPQKDNFPGGTKVDTGPPKFYWAPQNLSGAHAVKSFFA